MPFQINAIVELTLGKSEVSVVQFHEILTGHEIRNTWLDFVIILFCGLCFGYRICVCINEKPSIVVYTGTNPINKTY